MTTATATRTSNRVDRENKIIRGYKVMTKGEAKGHDMVVDEITLRQLEQLGRSAGGAGIKTRVKHPMLEGRDGLGSVIGKSKNFLREGESVLADLHLSPAAFVTPDGDWGTYLMDLAEDDADSFGASPEVSHSKENLPGARLPAMRLRELHAVALVDDPATNRGLFARLALSKGRTQLSEKDVAINLDYAIEYRANVYLASKMCIADYIAMRRVDDGHDALTSISMPSGSTAEHDADEAEKKAFVDNINAKIEAVKGDDHDDALEELFRAEYESQKELLQRAGVSFKDFVDGKFIEAVGMWPSESRDQRKQRYKAHQAKQAAGR